MKNELKQKQFAEYLTLLTHKQQETEWVSTREVSDALGVSIYLARVNLLALQSQGCVARHPEGRRGRSGKWRATAEIING